MEGKHAETRPAMNVSRETSHQKKQLHCRLLIKTKYTADNSQIVKTIGMNFLKLISNKKGEKRINKITISAEIFFMSALANTKS